MTRLSPTARSRNPPGFVLTLLTVDCAPIVFSAYQFPQPVCGFLCMPFAFYMLAQRAGPGAACCTASAFVIFAAATVPLSRVQKSLWVSTDEALYALVCSVFYSNVNECARLVSILSSGPGITLSMVAGSQGVS